MGLLIKPIVAIAYGVYLFKDIREIVNKYLIIWPVVGAVSDLHLFSIKPQGFESTLKFYKNFSMFFTVWNRLLLFKFASIIITITIIIKILKDKDQNIMKMLVILGIQLMTVSLLGGVAVYTHEYYFMAMSPMAILLSLYIIKFLDKKLIIIIILCGLGLNIEGMYYNLKSLKVTDKKTYMLRSDCIQMRNEFKEIPWNKGIHFRTSRENYPLIGLCVMERTNSKISDYGIYYNDEKAPVECRILKKYNVISIFKCERKIED